jgi:hypothetical protein
MGIRPPCWQGVSLRERNRMTEDDEDEEGDDDLVFDRIWHEEGDEDDDDDDDDEDGHDLVFETMLQFTRAPNTVVVAKFKPRPDITVYELASILTNVNGCLAEVYMTLAQWQDMPERHRIHFEAVEFRPPTSTEKWVFENKEGWA